MSAWTKFALWRCERLGWHKKPFTPVRPKHYDHIHWEGPDGRPITQIVSSVESVTFRCGRCGFVGTIDSQGGLI